MNRIRDYHIEGVIFVKEKIGLNRTIDGFEP
jgi:hypothetical protein